MAVQKYGLDLGTGTIKIYKDGQGMVLKEKNACDLAQSLKISKICLVM